jgi:hypothetical protein
MPGGGKRMVCLGLVVAGWAELWQREMWKFKKIKKSKKNFLCQKNAIYLQRINESERTL